MYFELSISTSNINFPYIGAQDFSPLSKMVAYLNVYTVFTSVAIIMCHMHNFRTVQCCII